MTKQNKIKNIFLYLVFTLTIIIFSQGVNAQTGVLANNNYTFVAIDYSASTYVQDGIVIWPKFNISVYNVTAGSPDIINVTVRSPAVTGSVVGSTGTKVGTTLVFTTPLNLTKGQNYSFTYTQTGSWNRNISSATLPIQSPHLNYSNRVDSGVIRTDNYLHNFNQIITCQQNETCFAIAASNFTITATEISSGSTINNFSANISGTNYSTTTGTITTNILNNDTSLYNITIYNAIDSNGAFFNKTYNDYNVTSNLGATLIQAEIHPQAFELATNNSLNGSFVSGSQSDSQRIFLPATQNNITFVNTSYYNKTQEFTITALSNTTVDITNVYNAIIYLRATNLSGGEQLTNLSGYVNITSLNYPINYSTLLANVSVGTLAGYEHEIYLTSRPNYTTNYLNNFILYNTSSAGKVNQSVNFTLYRDQSFFIYVRDLTSNLLLDEINMTLTGSETYTYTFNQSKYAFNLTPYVYTATISKSGYGDVSTTINITEGGLENKTVYLTESPTTATIYVRNEFNQYLSDATVTVIRASDNSVIDTGTTDFTGGVQFTLLRSTAYILNVTREGYLNYSESYNFIQLEETVTILKSSLFAVPYYQGISYNFSPSSEVSLPNNTPQNFSFYYLTNYWNIDTAYLIIYGVSNNTYTQLNSSQNSTSNSITLESDVFNYSSIQIWGVLTVNGTNITYKQSYPVGDYYEGLYSLNVFLKNLSNFNRSGWGFFSFIYLVIMIILGITTASLVSRDIKGEGVTIFLAFLITMAFSISNLIPLGTGDSFINQYGIAIITGLLTFVWIGQNVSLKSVFGGQ